MDLAEKIMQLRKQNGWSQEELAERLDVTRQSVSKWESGQALPEIDKIIKLSEVFGVTTDYLLKTQTQEKEREENTSTQSPDERENFHYYEAQADGHLGNVVFEKKQKRIGVMLFESIYWPLVVLIYLLISFLSGNWGRSWIIWPVAAVVFAISNAILIGLGIKKDD